MARDMEESNDPEAHGPSPIGTSAQVQEASPVRVNDVIPPLNRLRMDAVRIENYQEIINKRVLLDWVRITGLENKNHWRYDRLLAHLSNVILGYPNEGDRIAFTWPTRAGNYRGIPAIRAKVSYHFWRYFMSEGRKKLAAYNKDRAIKIAILREQVLRKTDETNLGLIVRKKLYELYKEHGEKVPDMSVKQGILHIGPRFVIKPAMCAIRMGLSLPEWQGLSFIELLSEMEKNEYNRGVFKSGDLTFDVLKSWTKASDNNDQREAGEMPRGDEDSEASTDNTIGTGKRKRTLAVDDDINPVKRVA